MRKDGCESGHLGGFQGHAGSGVQVGGPKLGGVQVGEMVRPKDGFARESAGTVAGILGGRAGLVVGPDGEAAGVFGGGRIVFVVLVEPVVKRAAQVEQGQGGLLQEGFDGG